ncbi:MAG: transporter, Ompp1/FadL/TodX family protein [Leptospiraceae bacterium]|nr:transporter, Ompp1/FadL/TodX family protein [Leptospiraceae bacterium]MCP5503286.1 transporter, Ompp1/FadL/TodX family protein [Leptospiraceae bacterium]
MPYIFLLLLVIFSSSILSDTYHNINGLIGERAAGMGGAFSAISDDPSGAFYNPAGIAFAYDNFVSISANTYKETEKRYQNVFGPGQDYVRKSRGFSPNFIGTIKSFEKLKVGFSVISPNNEQFDQADFFYLPQSRPLLSSYRIDYTESNELYNIGLSAGYPLSNKLAIGGSLFFFNDTSRIQSTQIIEGKDGAFSHISTQDRRKTLGLTPALGLQFMPTDKFALGASVKRHFVTAESRSITSFNSKSSSSNYTQTTLSTASQNSSSIVSNGLIYAGPAASGKIPEITEIRSGLAWFANKSFIASFDMIFTDGFSSSLSRSLLEAKTGTLIIKDTEDPLLSREPTLNYAFGLEFFPIDILALRFGMYTNFSNNKPIEWGDAAVDLYLTETSRNSISLANNLIYQPEVLQAKTRLEYINNTGYSLGISWATAKSSITLTYIYEYGKGVSQIDPSQLPQSVVYRNTAFYLIASSHN